MLLCIFTYIGTHLKKKKNKLSFLEQFKVHPKLSSKYGGFPFAPCPRSGMQSLPVNIPTRRVHLFQSMNWHGLTIVTLSLELSLGFTLGAASSIGLDKCVKICVHSIESHRVISLPWKSCALPPSPLLGHTHLFTAFTVLSFIDHHVVENTWYVA